MKKRILSALLVLAMVFSMLPLTTSADTVSYDESSSNNTTITVTDDSDNPITDATVTVTRSSNTYEVYNAGDGSYIFTRDRTSENQTYSITVSAPNYETNTATVSGNTTSSTVTLTYSGPEIATFRVFYIADGHVPSSYAGAGAAADYGPSANDTPLVEINVNITMLRELAAQEGSPVSYIENGDSGNQWEFVPSGSRDDEDNHIAYVHAFWEAVISCTEEASITAFKATGLYPHYAAYCLKKQANGTLHSDGVLDATPPVYVVELYEQHEGTEDQPVYFGGGISDSTQEEFEFLSPADILQQYEDHLGLTITWVEDENGKPLFENDQFSGTYIHDHHYHHIYIYEFDMEDATEETKINDIYYTKQTDTYYLAKYNMYIDQGAAVSYVVTYTDGVDDEVIFANHEYPANASDTVPAYTGVTLREGYIFKGWLLEGDDTGTLYSNEDLQTMLVTGDMTFHAQWLPSGKVVFHANNPDATCHDSQTGDDTFLTFYPAGVPLPEGTSRSLNEDGTLPLFYDIPEFSYDVHNDYIFKGWYTAADESGDPIDWNAFALTGTDAVHVYAHWFETGEVKQSDDGKTLPADWNGTYQGFDLVGIQIRTATQDDQAHHGQAGAGLRFITVLSQELYSQINALPGNESGAEYGFALGKTNSITALEQGIQGVTMFPCSGVPDHYSNAQGDTGYRLYTCVITYDSVANDPDKLAAAQNTPMAARAYLRYYDANGLYRTYYNNYTGNPVHSGCSASYNTALEMLGL